MAMVLKATNFKKAPKKPQATKTRKKPSRPVQVLWLAALRIFSLAFLDKQQGVSSYLSCYHTRSKKGNLKKTNKKTKTQKNHQKHKHLKIPCTQSSFYFCPIRWQFITVELGGCGSQPSALRRSQERRRAGKVGPVWRRMVVHVMGVIRLPAESYTISYRLGLPSVSCWTCILFGPWDLMLHGPERKVDRCRVRTLGCLPSLQR